MNRCMDFRERSPEGREMMTSGGEREERRAWTHDSITVRNLLLSTFIFKSVCYLRNPTSHNALRMTQANEKQ